jgi:hypothetical protein
LVRIGKHSSDIRGMLAEDWNNQVFTTFCKSDDSYPPILGAFRPADESFSSKLSAIPLEN